MERSVLINEVKEIASKAAEDLGYELVDVEFKDGSKHSLISIYIYSKDGISLDDCTEFSRKVEDDIDSLDIKKSYYLEVSSPGLDRPLKTQDDFRRNLNKEVEVKLFAPINGKKSFVGELFSYDKDSLTLKDENGNEIQIPIKSISLTKQTIKF
ncbi:ribosome maturation factor RimP [Peptoniphilus catoniae]|uniref:ribosome maturation factor RimP n=1 Tax=Peptoniphilus catoniae TaxID=1660341 RepID=UPI0010FEC35C|nr:ribosome maturation factor RimP [Peptoniphilus catoniae]